MKEANDHLRMPATEPQKVVKNTSHQPSTLVLVFCGFTILSVARILIYNIVTRGIIIYRSSYTLVVFLKLQLKDL